MDERVAMVVRDALTVGLAFAAGMLSGGFSMGGQLLTKPGIRFVCGTAMTTVRI